MVSEQAAPGGGLTDNLRRIVVVIVRRFVHPSPLYRRHLNLSLSSCCVSPSLRGAVWEETVSRRRRWRRNQFCCGSKMLPSTLKTLPLRAPSATGPFTSMRLD